MFGIPLNNIDLNIDIVNDMQAAMRPLNGLDNAALQKIVNDDAETEEYLSKITLTTRNSLSSQKEMIMTQNKSLAEYNLTFEPMLQEGRNNLKELMLQIEQVKSSVQRKEGDTKHDGMSSETALALLQTAAAESEEESEKLAEMFNQKEIDVEEFLEKFQDTRKRMHLRRVKAEKMVDLVSQKSSRPLSGPPRRAAPLPPYPVGPNSFFNHM